MVQLTNSWTTLAAVLSLFVASCQADTTVTVTTTTGPAIPKTLWGQSFEDVNHSGDGGLYAELLRNRAFQQVTPNTPEALNFWHSINGAELNVIADPVPVSKALPNSLQVKIPTGRFGLTGFGNEGYNGGLKVEKGVTYTASFYYRFPTASSFRGTVAVGYQTTSGLTLGSTSATISGAQTTWLQVSVTFTPAQSAFNNNNYFTIVFDSTAAAGQTVHFAMLSLFPPTYRSRVNGLRPDLATALAEMQPGFLRFPGGRNLEGNTIDTRWQWNNTVGKLVDRPGRVGTWGYVNTDGLGLLEFLTLCEDLVTTPIMGVWAGFSLDGHSVSEQDLFPYIQQAIDQINFAIAPTSNPFGLLRSQLGHSAPFALTYIEIGNEEFFSSDTYASRWRFFTTVLSQNFPQLRFIATSYSNNPVLAPDPTHWDVHSFKTPGWFAQNSFFYDGLARNGTMYLEGEYAAVSNDPIQRHDRLPYPTMKGAASEAAYMTGLERNSDIVLGSSYSPLLNRIGDTEITPNLISFDISTVYRSTSFYTQMLFSTNRGVSLMTSTLPNPSGTIFWTITRNSASQYVFKIVNVAADLENVTFKLPVSVSAGTLIVLQGDPEASNTPETPGLVVPVTTSYSLSGAKNTFVYAAPPYSVSILRLL
ncbi:alfa-L-arabinofuranosidase precursor [Collybia nuda]|uniref:non-reducing end alpha-L-arabinofuranosidase n=1 Tax=Collybia nuda TaxID=64659 RepID=A0A9P6CKT1_9AGAR|nr:alfa-L-arabinofuranosidase precursor [Collybia nuda]